MKRTIIVAVMAMVALCAGAQEVKVTLNPLGKAPSKNVAMSYVGSDGQQVVTIQNRSRVNVRLNFEKFDMNYTPLASVKLDRSGSNALMGGFVNGDHVDVLMKSEEDGLLTVYRERRSLSTLEVMGEPKTVASQPVSKKTPAHYTAYMSPNQQLVAGLMVSVNERGEAELKTTLMNREMEEYWTMSTPLTRFSSARVTNDGEVMVAGWGYEKETSVMSFEAIVLDGENDHTYRFTHHCEGVPSEVSLAKYADGQIFIMMSLKSDAHKRSANACVDRLVSLLYDTRSGSLSTDLHALTEQELCVLNNISDGSRTDSFVRYFSHCGAASQADGYVMAFTQEWSLYVDGALRNHNLQGLLLLGVDGNGRFSYGKQLRYSYMLDAQHLGYFSPYLVSAGDKAMLCYTLPDNRVDVEHNSTKRVIPINPRSKKSVMAVHTIDAQGNMTHHYPPTNTKIQLTGAPHKLSDGKWLLLFSNGKKACTGLLEMAE